MTFGYLCPCLLGERMLTTIFNLFFSMNDSNQRGRLFLHVFFFTNERIKKYIFTIPILLKTFAFQGHHKNISHTFVQIKYAWTEIKTCIAFGYFLLQVFLTIFNKMHPVNVNNLSWNKLPEDFKSVFHKLISYPLMFGLALLPSSSLCVHLCVCECIFNVNY